MKKFLRYGPSAACLLYYLLVCIVTGRLNGAQIVWLALAAFFGLYGWLWISVRGSRGDAAARSAGFRRRRLALRICTVLMIAGLACGAVAEGVILSSMVKEPSPGADYVIVLGAKVNGTTPSLTLRCRIDSAAEYLAANPESKAVASGGQGPDEGIAEGIAIAGALEAKGIDPVRILIEDRSTSTEENLRFSRALIESDGGGADSQIVIVTSDFHMFRTLRIAERAGYTNVTGQTAEVLWALVPQNHLREVLAVGFYWITGAL